MTDWFAGDVAERYDESTAGMPVEPVVDFLEPLAGGGALELAIGTGRIAVPLAERGHPRRRHRPLAGHGRAAAEEDGRDPGRRSATCRRRRSTARSRSSTSSSTRSSTCRRRSGRSRASRTPPRISSRAGAFVVEIMVPELQRLPLGDVFLLFDATPDTWAFDEYDLVTQGLTSHHFIARRRRVAATFRAVPLHLALGARPHGAARRAWSCASAGRTGTARRSPPRARSTSRSGRST